MLTQIVMVSELVKQSLNESDIKVTDLIPTINIMEKIVNDS